MSSNASSSGIESDTDSSPSLAEEKENTTHNESIETLIANHDDDEGFSDLEINPKSISDQKKQPEPIIPTPPLQTTASKSKPSHYPRSIRNPYDDDTNSSSVVEDWDEECQLAEPYYFPSYIRRAQWPNHWRWTPPLGIRRTCTQQLHRNLGFQPTGLYEDHDVCFLNIDIRHFSADFR